jgi:hypothetical protein
MVMVNSYFRYTTWLQAQRGADKVLNITAVPIRRNALP